MTAAAFAAELAEVADESLLRTNPVWCVDRIVTRWARHDASWAATPRRLRRVVETLTRLGTPLPVTALERWSRDWGLDLASPSDEFANPPAPGVVGVLIDVVARDAWVVPLSAERTAEWRVAPTLPFSDGTSLQDLFLKLLQAHSLPHLDRVPERFAFTLTETLGRRGLGPSLHVAGLLALVREGNGRPPAFDRACAVVQPQGDRLVPVGSCREKLDAFLRECGTGTLLVRCRGDGVAEGYDRHFQTVWAIDSLAELAHELDGRQWLDAFLTVQRLNAADARAVSLRVRRLESAEHRYRDALKLSERASRCGFGSDVPAQLREEFRQDAIELNRHLGAYHQSAQLAQEASRASRGSTASSYDG